jgi:hypothetical protein
MDLGRVKLLSKEISKVVDKAIKSFSVKRAVGIEDEAEDTQEPLDDSIDDEDSLGFLGDESNKILGPNIPTERRSTLINIIQKMNSVMNEKRSTKESLFQNWRLARFNEKIKQVYAHGQACLLLRKVSENRLNAFYRIKEYSESQKVSRASVEPKFFESQLVDPSDNMLQSQLLSGQPSQLPKNMDSLKSELDDLQKKLKANQARISNLEGENSSLKKHQGGGQIYTSEFVPASNKTDLTPQKDQGSNSKQEISEKKQQGELESTRKRVMSLENENTNLKSKIGVMDKELQSRAFELKAVESDWTRRLDENKLQIQKLMSQGQETEAKLKKDILALKAKVEEGEKALLDLKQRSAKDLSEQKSKWDLEKKILVEEKQSLLEQKNDEIRRLKVSYEEGMEKLKSQTNDRVKQIREQSEKQNALNVEKFNSLSKRLADHQDVSLDELVQARLKIEKEKEGSKLEQSYDDLENANFKLRSQLEIADREKLNLKEIIEGMKKGGEMGLSGLYESRVSNQDKGEGLKVSKQHQGQVLTNLKKARFLHGALKEFQRRLKARAFFEVLKATVRSKNAVGYASSRLKGRILHILSERYNDGGVRKAFLRWMVFIDKTFLRDCITKVALNSRITHQSALWRFRKLVIKNIRVRLPEAARRLRMAEGLHILKLIVALNRKGRLIEAFANLRPGIVGKKYRLLISILNRKVVDDEMSKLEAFRRLIIRQRIQKAKLGQIIERLEDKLREAFNRLRQHKLVEAAKEDGMDKVYSTISSVDVLRRKAFDNITESLQLRESTAALLAIQEMKNRLGFNLKLNLREAYNRLKQNRLRLLQSELNSRKTQRGIISMLIEKQLAKVKDSAGRLRDYCQSTKSEDALRLEKEAADRKLKDKILKGLLSKFRNAQKGKLWNFIEQARLNALDSGLNEKLNENRLNGAQLLKKRLLQATLDKLSNSQRTKQRIALETLAGEGFKMKSLKDISEKERLANLKLNEKTLKNMLAKLRIAQEGKQQASVDRLHENYLKLSQQNSLLDEKSRAELLLRKKALNKMMSRLILAQEGKQKESVRKLNENNIKLKATEGMDQQALAAKEALKLKTLKGLVNRMTQGMGAKLDKGFSALKTNKTVRNMQEELQKVKGLVGDTIKRRRLDELMEKLRLAQIGKQKEVLRRLHLAYVKANLEENLKKFKLDNLDLLKRKTLENMLDRLALAQKAKLKWSVDRFRAVRKELGYLRELNKIKDESVKKLGTKLLGSIIDKINRANESKKKEMWNNLRENYLLGKHADEIGSKDSGYARTLKKKILGSVFDRLVAAQKAKEIQAFKTIKEAAQLSAIQNKLVKKILGGLLGKLKNTCGQLEKDALYKLWGRKVKLSADEQLKAAQEMLANKEKRRITVGLLERLVKAQAAKERIAYSKLTGANLELGHEAELRRLKEENDRSLRLKALKHLIGRLRLAQGEKKKDALDTLINGGRNSKLLGELSEANNLTAKMKKLRKIDAIFERLKFAQKAKEFAAFNVLKESNDQLKLRDMMKSELDSVNKKLSAKSVKGMVNQLSRAQQAKEKESLMDMLLRWRNGASDDKYKKKVLAQLLRKLKAAQMSKEKIALAKLLGKANEISRLEAGRKRTLRGLFNNLLNKQQSKLKDILQVLGANAAGLDKNEAVERARKDLLEKLRLQKTKSCLNTLKKGMDEKCSDSLSLLLSMLNKVKSAEAIEKEKTLAFIQKLLKAQETKLLDGYGRLFRHFMDIKGKHSIGQLMGKLAQEKERAAMNFLLEKLKTAQEAKTREVVKALRGNNSYLKGIETVESLKANQAMRLKVKTLMGMMRAQGNKGLFALLKFREFNKDQQAGENERIFNERILNQKRKAKYRLLFAQLVKAQSAKVNSCYKELIKHMLNERFVSESLKNVDLLNKEKTNNMLKLLLMRNQNKRDDAWKKLYNHANLNSNDPALIKKNVLISDLINAQEQKVGAAFRRLTLNYRVQSMEESKSKNLKNRLLRGLINSSEGKLKGILALLRGMNTEAAHIEKDKKSKTNLFLDKIGEWGTTSQSKNKQMVYGKLVAYAQEQKRAENLKRAVFLNLLKAQDSKAKDSANRLRQYYLFAWGEQKFNTTLSDIQMDKELSLKRNLLKKLYKSMGLTAKIALRLLRNNNNSLKEKEEETKLRLEKLMGMLNSNKNQNRAAAYKLLVNSATKQKENEAKYKDVFKLIFSKLAGNNNLNKKDVLNRLLMDKRLGDMNFQKEKKSLQNMLRKLILAQVSKTKQCFDSFRALNGILAKDYFLKKSKYLALFNRLIKAQEGKVAEGLLVLSHANKHVNQEQERRNELLQSLLAQLGGSQGLKLGDAFSKLRDSANVDRLKNAQKEKGILGLLNRIAGNSQRKLLDGLFKLKDFGQLSAIRDIAQRNKMAALVTRLVATQNQRMRIAFIILGLNKQKLKEEAEKKGRLIGLIGRRLPTAYNNKFSDAFKNLKNHSDDTITLENLKIAQSKMMKVYSTSPEEESRETIKGLSEVLARACDRASEKLKAAINRLLQAQKGKVEFAMAELLLNEKKSRLNSSKVLSAQQKLLSCLAGGSNGKKGVAFLALKKYRDNIVRDQELIKSKLLSILNKLTNAQQMKLLEAVKLLKMNREEITLKSEKFRSRLHFIFNKIAGATSNKKIDAFHLLRNNQKEKEDIMRRYTSGMKFLIIKIISASNDKSLEAVRKLKSHHNQGSLGLLTSAMKKASMIKSLISSSDDKLRVAYLLLKLNRTNMNQLYAAKADASKFLINKLLTAQIAKTTDSLNKLSNKATSDYIKDDIKRKRRVLLVGTLMNACRFKQIDALHKLGQHRATLEKQGLVQKSLIGWIVRRLDLANQTRALEALFKLSNHTKLLNNKAALTKDRMSFILNKLAAAYSTKELHAEQLMKINRQTASLEETLRQRSLRGVFNRLIAAQQAKQKYIFNRLSSSTKLKTQLLEKALLMLTLAQRSKSLESLDRLKVNRDVVNAEIAKQVNARSLLVERLVAAQKDRMRNGLYLLKKNANDSRLRDARRLLPLSGIMAKMRKALEGKMSEALAKLAMNKECLEEREDELMRGMEDPVQNLTDRNNQDSAVEAPISSRNRKDKKGESDESAQRENEEKKTNSKNVNNDPRSRIEVEPNEIEDPFADVQGESGSGKDKNKKKKKVKRGKVFFPGDSYKNENGDLVKIPETLGKFQPGDSYRDENGTLRTIPKGTKPLAPGDSYKDEDGVTRTIPRIPGFKPGDSYRDQSGALKTIPPQEPAPSTLMKSGDLYRDEEGALVKIPETFGKLQPGDSYRDEYGVLRKIPKGTKPLAPGDSYKDENGVTRTIPRELKFAPGDSYRDPSGALHTIPKPDGQTYLPGDPYVNEQGHVATIPENLGSLLPGDTYRDENGILRQIPKGTKPLSPGDSYKDENGVIRTIPKVPEFLPGDSYRDQNGNLRNIPSEAASPVQNVAPRRHVQGRRRSDDQDPRERWQASARRHLQRRKWCSEDHTSWNTSSEPRR